LLQFIGVLDDITDANRATFELLFNNYLSNTSSPITARAGPNSLSNTLLAGGFDGFTMNTPVRLSFYYS